MQRKKPTFDVLCVAVGRFFFRVRKLPSLVETIIVMTIQIVAHDKGNDFLASLSLSRFFLSLALFFSPIQISFTPLLVFVSMEKQWPSSCSLSPLLFFSLVIIALLLRFVNTKVVTTRRKTQEKTREK